MKVRYLMAAAIFTMSFASGSFGQTPTKAVEKPAFDAELAKKLGADEYGMKNYILVILKTGPSDATITGKAREDLFKGHMANIQKMADEGKLAIAGPFVKNDKGFRGLYVFNVTSLDEARQIAETDPAVKAGIFIADLTPWYGSASLMVTPEIHKKISKATP